MFKGVGLIVAGRCYNYVHLGCLSGGSNEIFWRAGLHTVWFRVISSSARGRGMSLTLMSMCLKGRGGSRVLGVVQVDLDSRIV